MTVRCGALVAVAACALAPASAFAHGRSSTDTPFVDAQVGAAYSDVVAFSNSQLIPGVTESREWGSHFGGTAGLRFGPIALGVHGDFSRFRPYDIGTLGGLVELRLPIPAVQPYARVGLGYAWLGDVNVNTSLAHCGPTSSSAACPSIRGWSLMAGAGIDFWLSRFVTLGGGLDLYVLNLTRSASPTMVTFAQSGDSVGLQLAVTAQLGIHI